MKASRATQLFRIVLIPALLVTLLLGTFHQAAAATIVYVKSNAHGANNGTSWADAYKSLATALKKAPAGSQIWVAKGTYLPVFRTSATDPRTATFTLRNGVALYGGFKGTETLLKQRKPLVNVTVLSGDIGAAGVYTDDVYHVVTSSLTKATAVLDGFQIMAGDAAGSGSIGFGGGLYNNAGSPTLRNLRFFLNYAVFGGGMMSFGGSPILTNIIFANNSADMTSGGGGGLYLFGATPRMDSITFDTNIAKNGGAMVNDTGSSLTITNATFYNNYAGSNGGGLYNSESTTTVLNATFDANAASGQGGAIDNNSGTVAVQESILWNDGSEIANLGAATATDALIQGGCSIGAGNCTNVFSSDPLLLNPANHGGFVTTQALSQSLGGMSPAVDAGGAHVACAPKDARGVKRAQGPACDLGAYEVNVATFTSSGAQDGQITESVQGSGLGKVVNSTATSIKVGDTAANQQMDGFLSFNTAALPDTAIPVFADLIATSQSVTGSGSPMFTSPWYTHGNLLVDLTKPFFGTSAGLAAGDFQAPALFPGATSFNPTPVGAVYHTDPLAVAALPDLNKTGTTQLRLHWTSTTDNDLVTDYQAFYSGDASASLRPRLVIYYNP